MFLKFKDWLLAEDAFDRTIMQNFPNAPSWVRKDLFKDNWLKKLAKSGKTATPFTDWLKNPRVQAFKNVTWPNQPQCISLHPTQLSNQTLTDLVVRRFGRKPMSTQAFNQEQDAAKTGTQCDIMASLSDPCGHVPIIIVKQSDGKYRMIEGWHRLMCRLLDGCPQQKRQLLDDPNLSHFKLWDALELDTWQPVQINAYVGVEGQQQDRNGQTATGQTPHDYHSPTAPFISNDGPDMNPAGLTGQRIGV